MAAGLVVAVVTWSLLPRNADLSRTADPVSGWSKLAAVERYNLNDTATLEGPQSALADLMVPGRGLIVMRDDELVMSGDVCSIAPSWSLSAHDGIPWVQVGVQGDLAHLGGRVVFPDRTHAITGTAAAVGASHDVRTGAREDLILGYVSACLGPDALASRRLPGLALPSSLGRGGSTTASARFDLLGTLVQDLAEAGGLRVTLRHDESTGTPRLLLSIETAEDVSAGVRFGPPSSAALGIITSYDVTLTSPSSTRSIVLGGGEDTARLALMASETDAETLWHRIVETVVDQRQTTDQDEMTDAATKALSEAAGDSTIAFTVADGPDVTYRTDYRVGSRVGVDLPGLPVAATDNVVREVTTTVQVTSGQPVEQVQIAVGSTGSSTKQTAGARRIAQMLTRLAALERSA